MRHDWPFKTAIVDLLLSLKGNSNCISSNFVESVGGPEEGFRHCFANSTNQGYLYMRYYEWLRRLLGSRPRTS